MPSTSKAQARLMMAAAHNRAFAKKAGVPMSVAKDFVAADQKRKKRNSKFYSDMPERKGKP